MSVWAEVLLSGWRGLAVRIRFIAVIRSVQAQRHSDSSNQTTPCGAETPRRIPDTPAHTCSNARDCQFSTAVRRCILSARAGNSRPMSSAVNSAMKRAFSTARARSTPSSS